MPTELDKIKGQWGPGIYQICRELGPAAAMVFSVVFGYCRMRDGVCRAEAKTIAATLNLNRETVYKALHALADAGYIADTTPEAHRKPHAYEDTGLASAVVKLTRRRVTEDIHRVIEEEEIEYKIGDMGFNFETVKPSSRDGKTVTKGPRQ